MLTRNNTMKTLYVNEFENFMKKVDLWEDFTNNGCVCKYCGDIIKRENLHALIPVESRIEFCCSKPCCISEFSEEL